MYIITYHNHYCFSNRVEICNEPWEVKDMIHNLISNGVPSANINIYSAVQSYEFDTFKEECADEENR